MGASTLIKPKRSLRDLKVKAKKRLCASPVKRIFNEETDETIGWVYQWNTGEQVKIMRPNL